MIKTSDLFPLVKTGTGGAAESDPIAMAAIQGLSTAVAALPTNATLTPIKDDIAKLQTDIAGLASKTDLAAAAATLATVEAAVKKLEADGSPEALKLLQDAVTKANSEIAALKTKQDATNEAAQKTTQSVADLTAALAKLALDGVTGTAVAEVKTKLNALDTSKADKTALDTLSTTVQGLTTALAAGATDAELATEIQKVNDAIAVIDATVKTLVGRTLYTTTQTINVIPGDSVYIDLAGDIQLPTAPPDGSEVRVFDPLALIKVGQNNVLPGLGDRIGGQQGTVAINDPSPLSFDKDNQTYGGFLRLKYQQNMRSWNVWVVYGSPVTVGGTGTPTGTGLKPAVSTGNITLTANAFDVIRLSGTGDIQVGALGQLEYFDVQWNSAHSVTVLRPAGITIAGIDDDFLLDTANMGVTSLRFMLVGSNIEVYGNTAAAGSGGLKKAVLTGNAVLTANPFDVVNLGGTGDIQIGAFTELDYFEVQWNGNRSVTVLRPAGFTIDGADDDFLLDTAGMSVKRVRFTRVGLDFEVS